MFSDSILEREGDEKLFRVKHLDHWSIIEALDGTEIDEVKWMGGTSYVGRDSGEVYDVKQTEEKEAPYKAGDKVTWNGGGVSQYAVKATISKVTKRGFLWIYLEDDTYEEGAPKMVTANSLTLGWPEKEIKWW